MSDFKPTNELRFVSRDYPYLDGNTEKVTKVKILQQKWVRLLDREEWRDVPLEEEEV